MDLSHNYMSDIEIYVHKTAKKCLEWTKSHRFRFYATLNITGSSSLSARHDGKCSSDVLKRSINALRRKYIVLFLVIKHGGEYSRNCDHEGVPLKSANICLFLYNYNVKHTVISRCYSVKLNDGDICGQNDLMRRILALASQCVETARH